MPYQEPENRRACETLLPNLLHLVAECNGHVVEEHHYLLKRYNRIPSQLKVNSPHEARENILAAILTHFARYLVNR